MTTHNVRLILIGVTFDLTLADDAAAKPRTGAPAAGALYLGADNNVDIFPLSGPNGQEIGSIFSGISEPWGLNIDGSNSLYVANSGNGMVTVYPNGATTPSIKTYAHGVPRPLYALPDRAGNVYVSGVDDFPHAGSLFEYGAATGQIIAHRRKAIFTSRFGGGSDTVLPSLS